MTQPGVVKVKVLACRDLKNKDFWSENDPYVTILLEGGVNGMTTEIKTKILKGAGDPALDSRTDHGSGNAGAGQCVHSRLATPIIPREKSQVEKRTPRIPGGQRFRWEGAQPANHGLGLGRR